MKSGLLAALVAVLSVVTPARGVLLLQDVVDQHLTIQVGDKEFSNFDVVVTGQGSFIAEPVTVQVVPRDLNGPSGIEYGLRLAGVFRADSNVAPNSFVDKLVDFDVTVTRPGRRIHDITLAFHGAMVGDGHSQVIETVRVGTTIVGPALRGTRKLLNHLGLPTARTK